MSFIDWSDPDEMLGLLSEFVADELLAEREDQQRARFLRGISSALTSLVSDAPELSARATIEHLREIYDSQPAEFDADPVLAHLDDCILELERIAADSQNPCPSCGASLGGRDGCQAAFDRLIAEAWTDPGRASVHNLVVDAYAMQHSEEYGRSAKSYIAHLTALCCGVESAGDQQLYWAIGRWLDGRTQLARPDDISPRGNLTIADVEASVREPAYPEVVRRWARDVWGAYGTQQVKARQWLNAARADAAQKGPRGKR